jgi:hypothetical protein
MQKAQKALGDPAYEGKSNREIATLIGVAEGTVRNARGAQIWNGSNFTQPSEETGQDSEARSEPIECCGNCINRHKSGACYIDSVVRSEETAGCEDYERLPPEKPEPDVPEPDYENVNVIEPPDQDKTRRRNPNQYQKVKGCINLNLPPDNPQLFSIELPPEGEGRYQTFLHDAKLVNPHVRLIGFTATPYRMAHDRKARTDMIEAARSHLDVLADQNEITEGWNRLFESIGV